MRSETSEFLAGKAVLYVEGHRHGEEGVLTEADVVLLHIQE